MTRKRSPSFQFYADDFYAGTADMSLEEVGAYMRLLCVQWSKQKLQNNAQILQRIMIASREEYDRIWPVLSDKFGLSIEGGIANPRLEAVRDKQVARQKSGSKGGKAKRVAKSKQSVSKKSARKEMGRELEKEIGEGSKEEVQEKGFPPALDTKEFRAAWAEWLAFRREAKHKPVSEKAAAKKLDELAAIGSQRAVAAINNSIANDYQGIFEPGTTNAKKQFVAGAGQNFNGGKPSEHF